MSDMSNLLVELFVEELPPKALKKLGEAFATVLADSLKGQGLAGADAAVTAFASPRRLAVHVTDVATQAADKAQRIKLMPVAVALGADGQPTPALLKKLASVGADASAVPQLVRLPDGKAEALFLDSLAPGASLAEGLQKAIDETLARLPIPKVMTYQLADGWSDVKFVRPAHGLVALHGSEVVAVTALGLTAGRRTGGHRFEAATPVVDLRHADHYAEQLRDEGAVIASFAERRAEIVRQLSAAAAKEGLQPIDDEALLDEVTLFERAVLAGLANTDSARGATSVLYNLIALERASMALRERLSSEHWGLIRTMREMFAAALETGPGELPTLTQVLPALDRLALQLAAVTGAQTDRMTRDHGWRLLTVGRLLERLIGLALRLRAFVDAQALASVAGIDLVLELFDSLITFRARYQRHEDLLALADLLVLDSANPRAFAGVLRRLRTEIGKLPGQPESLQPLLAMLPAEGAGLTALKSGSSQHGNARRQSVACIWVVAMTRVAPDASV